MTQTLRTDTTQTLCATHATHPTTTTGIDRTAAEVVGTTESRQLLESHRRPTRSRIRLPLVPPPYPTQQRSLAPRLHAHLVLFPTTIKLSLPQPNCYPSTTPQLPCLSRPRTILLSKTFLHFKQQSKSND